MGSYEAVRKYNAYMPGIISITDSPLVPLDLKRLAFQVLDSQITRLRKRMKPIGS